MNYHSSHGSKLLRGSRESAGLDLASSGNFTINPGQIAAIETGIHIDSMPIGHYGQIFGRSGFSLRAGLTVLGGVIDRDYRGEIKVILGNFTQKPVKIAEGNRIAQLILLKYSDVIPVEISKEMMSKTERGDNGFGSTGL